MDENSTAGLPALVAVMWGKTGEVDRNLPDEAWHPLICHMFDAANVAGQVWDQYLADAVKASFGPPGTGRQLYMWLSALHDLGKCTPDFQAKSTYHYRRVNAIEPREIRNPGKFRHEELSDHIVTRLLTKEYGWPLASVRWIADIIAGHHGTFLLPPDYFTEAPPPSAILGNAAYRAAQRFLFDTVSSYCGVDPAKGAVLVPNIGAQLTMSGAVVKADWIASNAVLYPFDDCETKQLEGYARVSSQRAQSGFRRHVELGGVWRPDARQSAADLYASRFGISGDRQPRDTQIKAYELAREVEGPGLMVIESPTGEGKTEASLAAAEILAERFGFNGLFFALPTQATTDGIYNRLAGAEAHWANSYEEKPTIRLAHGKARLNEAFADLPRGGVGDAGCDTLTSSSWMRGAHKALLSPVVLGTIDQLLFAGVATRFVQLRHLGLANKVVVIDEVHAYDTYMSGVLHRVLSWLGAHKVPVVLLSATLPTAQRAELLQAYSGAAEVHVEGFGYPRLTWVDAPEKTSVPTSSLTVRSVPATTSRGGPIQVELAPERPGGDLYTLIESRLGGVQTGNILVLRNTVARAQSTHERLRGQFPDFEVTLAHARFTAGDRKRVDAQLRDRYGPPVPNPDRPCASIVVATQVAEQSLDIDFDLVISDLAPIDLLLQRAGRCHRHAERDRAVRGRLTTPTLIVTGFLEGADGAPALVGGTRRPYDHHLLLRTLAALAPPEPRTEIVIPEQVPGLIDLVYRETELGPASWQTAMAEAWEDFKQHRAELEGAAKAVLLASPGSLGDCLGGLQPFVENARVPDDEEEAARRLPVRYGPPSVEVILLRRTSPTSAVTASGAPLTVPLNRTPSAALMNAIGDQAIRLPLWMLDESSLVAPAGWSHAPWAQRLRVLLLDSDGTSVQRKKRYSYSSSTGWTPQE